jgi:hypothetical protein
MAAECSPGRKPGDQDGKRIASPLQRAAEIVRREILSPLRGSMIYLVRQTPGLRPGLHSAARFADWLSHSSPVESYSGLTELLPKRFLQSCLRLLMRVIDVRSREHGAVLRQRVGTLARKI